MGQTDSSPRAPAASTLEHPAGIVVWIDRSESRSGFLRPAIQRVATARDVFEAESVDDVIEALRENQLQSDLVVCFVCAREAAVKLAKLRSDPNTPASLASLPVVCITRSRAARRACAAVGTVIVNEPGQLAERVLSLPNLAILRGEPAAGLFIGESTDLRFGHKLGKDTQEFRFARSREELRRGLSRARLEWYPEMTNMDEHLAQVAAYMEGLCPIHRCKPGTFLAVLREGGLLSRVQLECLFAEDPEKAAVIRCARNPRLQHLVSKASCRSFRREIFRFAEKVCTEALANPALAFGPEDGAPLDLSDEDRDELIAAARECAKDCVALREGKVGGIGCAKDKLLGTDRHVFSTLGPNVGWHYGSVVLILKRSLLFHPGVWATPLAATGFVGPAFWAFANRPWARSAINSNAITDDTSLVGGQEAFGPFVSRTSPEAVESDDMGVDICLGTAVNLAGSGQAIFKVMAQEEDAMCRYVVDGRRATGMFDAPYDAADKRRDAAAKLLCSEDTFRKDGWKQVVEFYETKDSHGLFETHLPPFVPLAAVDRVIVPDELYKAHSEIRDKIDTFVFPDGRRLRDLVTKTQTKEECVENMHDFFDRRREECLRGPAPSEPVCVRLEGRKGKPCFLPSDFQSWACNGGQDQPGVLRISFCCRATHDIRVVFSNTPMVQRPDTDINDACWTEHLYELCLGWAENQVSYISRGFGMHERLTTQENSALDRCWSASEEEGLDAIAVWERYWFDLTSEDTRVILRCGRGPWGQEVMLEAVDPNPISDVCYIGLSCWNEPTTYCDLRCDHLGELPHDATPTPARGGSCYDARFSGGSGLHDPRVEEACYHRGAVVPTEVDTLLSDPRIEEVTCTPTCW